MRAVPSTAADRSASAVRRPTSRSPGARLPSGNSPCSPRVAYTTTTRWPSSTARASVPAWVMHSSSGWAWKATIVTIPLPYQIPAGPPPVSGDGAGLAQLGDAVGVEPGGGQDLVGVLPGVGRRRGD